MSQVVVPPEHFRRLGLQAPARRVPIPFGAQTVADMLDPWVATRPEAEALVGRHTRHTYAQLETDVNAAAAGLQALGLRQADVIAACTANHPDIVVAFLAAQRLGLIWVGINRNLAAAEKAWMLQHAGARWLLADTATVAQLAASARAADLQTIEMNGDSAGDAWRALVARHRGATRPPVHIDPWAPALISFTSGTTGRPKGVVHSQHNAVLVGAAAVHRRQWDIHLRRGSGQPLTINNIMVRFAAASLYAGATFVCMDRLDTAGTVDWLRREGIEAFSAVPTMVYDLLNEPDLDLSTLDVPVRPIVGAARMSDALRQRFRGRFGSELQFTYGLTEAPTAVAQTDPHETFVPGSSGRALPHLQLAVLDDTGHVLAAGEEGEIAVGPCTTGFWDGVYTPALGYWNDPEATQGLLRGGWLHTGDAGVIDARGHLFVKDRRSDLIIRGGANVYPAEIEQAIAADSRVRACAVLGLPDDRLGERVAAVVEVAGGAAAAAQLLADLHAACMLRHARYKVPVDWFAVDCMPRNAMNKVVKPLLKQAIASGTIALAWSAPCQNKARSAQ